MKKERIEVLIEECAKKININPDSKTINHIRNMYDFLQSRYERQYGKRYQLKGSSDELGAEMGAWRR
jgi:hypothetical protein